MTDRSPRSPNESSGAPTESAINQIVQMNPRRVTVALTLPATRSGNKGALVTLEWTREDPTMPLGQLLARIDTYVAQYGSK